MPRILLITKMGAEGESLFQSKPFEHLHPECAYSTHLDSAFNEVNKLFFLLQNQSELVLYHGNRKSPDYTLNSSLHYL